MTDERVRYAAGAKSARAWAEEIARLPTRAERIAALRQVPEPVRDLVRELVESAYALNSARRRR